MIRLHHFGADPVAFDLNPDLIFTVEARPDTIIHTTHGQDVLVTETPAEVREAIRQWRAGVLAAAHAQAEAPETVR